MPAMMQVHEGILPMNIMADELALHDGGELPMIESRKHYLMLLGLLLSATMLAGSASAQPLSPSALPIPTGVVTLVLWLLMVGFGLRTGQSWGQSLDRRWGHYPRFSLLLGGIGLLVSAVIGFAMLRSF